MTPNRHPETDTAQPANEDKMTPEDFTDARNRLGLSQRQMAKELGLSRHAEHNYTHGVTTIPRYIGLACAALVAGLDEHSCTTQQTPRGKGPTRQSRTPPSDRDPSQTPTSV